jgi:hypothetical protein
VILKEYSDVTCDSNPIQFSAFAVDMCFTESSFSSDDSYYSSYYYTSSMTSFRDTSSSSTRQKLLSKAMSNMKSYSSEGVGAYSYYYAPTIGPSEWSCYNPNKQDDSYYYYYNSSYYYSNSSKYSIDSSSPVTAKQQSQRKSRSLLASSHLFSCPPYAGKNTNSSSQNFTVCSYELSGDKPVIITGTLHYSCYSQLTYFDNII